MILYFPSASPNFHPQLPWLEGAPFLFLQHCAGSSLEARPQGWQHEIHGLPADWALDDAGPLLLRRFLLLVEVWQRYPGHDLRPDTTAAIWVVNRFGFLTSKKINKNKKQKSVDPIIPILQATFLGPKFINLISS